MMVSRTKAQQLAGLVVWLTITFIAAAVGALASVQANTFYAELLKPAWAPPASLFGPVWSTLYTLIAIAAWLVWRQGGFAARRAALLLFLGQLALNALWSWLFFVWHKGALALVDIIALWLLIVATLIAFWRVKALAGALFLPYLLWVSFAAVLNYSLLQLNPQLLG
jgi:translocator protein